MGAVAVKRSAASLYEEGTMMATVAQSLKALVLLAALCFLWQNLVAQPVAARHTLAPPRADGSAEKGWSKPIETAAHRVGRPKQQVVSKAELAKHTSRDDCWVAIHGKVYDVTQFLSMHPGGVGTLLKAAGKDSTELFVRVGHQPAALRRFKASEVYDFE